MCVIMPNFIKIGWTVAEIWRFYVFFQNGGRPPPWICWAPIGTTHDDHLMVSIVVQNLVEIDVVVSLTWNFQYFARSAWKRLLTPKNWGFRAFGGFHPQNREQYQRNPQKGTPLRESTSFEPSSVNHFWHIWSSQQHADSCIGLCVCLSVFVTSRHCVNTRLNKLSWFYFVLGTAVTRSTSP